MERMKDQVQIETRKVCKFCGQQIYALLCKQGCKFDDARGSLNELRTAYQTREVTYGPWEPPLEYLDLA